MCNSSIWSFFFFFLVYGKTWKAFYFIYLGISNSHFHWFQNSVEMVKEFQTIDPISAFDLIFVGLLDFYFNSICIWKEGFRTLTDKSELTVLMNVQHLTQFQQKWIKLHEWSYFSEFRVSIIQIFKSKTNTSTFYPIYW